MAEEIVFSDYQAEVFTQAEFLLKTQGYLGEALFEQSYTLSKKLAEFVMENIPATGDSAAAEALSSYQGLLDIVPPPASAPPDMISPPNPTDEVAEIYQESPADMELASPAVMEIAKPKPRPAISTPPSQAVEDVRKKIAKLMAEANAKQEAARERLLAGKNTNNGKRNKFKGQISRVKGFFGR